MAAPGKPAKVPYTYREYCYLPSDGRRYEIVDGDLYVNPAPAPFHQTVSRRLQFAMMQCLEEPGIAQVFDAPIDLILSDTTVVQPDLVVVRTSREEIVTERAIEGVPDLVVEILSPTTKGNDVFLKKGAYSRHGVPEYWIVDPEHGLVEVHGLVEAAYELKMRYDRASTLTSGVFEQIRIPLAPVFRRR